MIFAHLSGSASLRELEAGIEVFRGELNHFGMSCAPTRTTIAYANEHRDWRYFEGVYYGLLKHVSAAIETSTGGVERRFKFKDPLFLVDSTTIDLCHSLYDRADFRATKGGIKVHLMLEHSTCLPVWVHITEAKCHDKKILETVDPVVSLTKGSFVCMDRAYNDYEMLHLYYETTPAERTPLRVAAKEPIKTESCPRASGEAARPWAAAPSKTKIPLSSRWRGDDHHAI